MPIQVMPGSLTTAKALQRLIRILLEKENLRRRLSPGNFGPRVSQEEEALLLLDRVMQVSRSTLALDELPKTVPSLRFTRRLSRLPRQILLLYLLLSPAGLLFFYFTPTG